MILLLFGPLFAVLVSWAEGWRDYAMLLTGEEFRGPALPYVMLVVALYAAAVVVLAVFQARWWALAWRALRAERPGDRSGLFRLCAASLLAAFAWVYVSLMGFVIVFLVEDVDYGLMMVAGNIWGGMWWLSVALTGLLAVATLIAGIRAVASGDHRRSGGDVSRSGRRKSDRRGLIAERGAWTVLGCSAASSAVLLTEGTSDITWPTVQLCVAVVAAGVAIVTGRRNAAPIMKASSR